MELVLYIEPNIVEAEPSNPSASKCDEGSRKVLSIRNKHKEKNTYS